MKTALWQVLPAFQIYRSLALTDRNNESFFFSLSSSSLFRPHEERQRERERQGRRGRKKPRRRSHLISGRTIWPLLLSLFRCSPRPKSDNCPRFRNWSIPRTISTRQAPSIRRALFFFFFFLIRPPLDPRDEIYPEGWVVRVKESLSLSLSSRTSFNDMHEDPCVTD